MKNPCDRAHPSPYSKCMRRLRDGNGKPRQCRNRRCPSAKCRAGYAEKEAVILERSFRTKPPGPTFVLGFADGESTGDRGMAGYLSVFNQKIKDRRKSDGIALEYDNRIEIVGGNPHCHLTIITSAAWSVRRAHSLIRAWWKASCPNRKVRVYGGGVRTVVGHANYVRKNLKDRRGFTGRRRTGTGKPATSCGRRRSFWRGPKRRFGRRSAKSGTRQGTHPLRRTTPRAYRARPRRSRTTPRTGKWYCLGPPGPEPGPRKLRGRPGRRRRLESTQCSVRRPRIRPGAALGSIANRGRPTSPATSRECFALPSVCGGARIRIRRVLAFPPSPHSAGGCFRRDRNPRRSRSSGER